MNENVDKTFFFFFCIIRALEFKNKKTTVVPGIYRLFSCFEQYHKKNKQNSNTNSFWFSKHTEHRERLTMSFSLNEQNKNSKGKVKQVDIACGS